MSDTVLPMWIIYDHPKDYPDNYVARLFLTDRPSDKVLLGSLEIIRQYFRDLGLVCLTRHPTDDPVIVEVWL